MLRTAPTYALRTEAGLTPCPCILHDCEGLKDEGGFAASEPLFCTIGGASKQFNFKRLQQTIQPATGTQRECR